MRQDQFESLQRRVEQLLDVFVAESDPTSWPGYGKKVTEMSRDERGDAYWIRRSAAATLSVALRITSLVEYARARTAGDAPVPGAVTPGEDDLEDQIKAGERQAIALMERLQNRGKS